MILILKALPVIIGGLAGFLYYRFIGCHGGWALTGNPLTAIVYGAIMGLLFSSFLK